MASTPSQKIISFEAFKGEAKAAVESLIKMAEAQLNARDAPMALRRDSLIEIIKHWMPQDEYIVEPKPRLGPYFHKLPRELREQIFSYLLISGDLRFMRTSRSMQQEGKSRLATEGIYRINLGFFFQVNCQKPSRQIAVTIQNVNIRLNSCFSPRSTLDRYPEIRLLDVVAGPPPYRKTCNISFEFYESGNVMVGHEVLSRLQRLRGFEKVVLRIRRNATGDAITNPFENFHVRLPLRATYKGFDMAREFLEPHLGEADLGSDKDGWNMVFYPRKTQERVAGVLRHTGGYSTPRDKTDIGRAYAGEQPVRSRRYPSRP